MFRCSQVKRKQNKNENEAKEEDKKVKKRKEERKKTKNEFCFAQRQNGQKTSIMEFGKFT